MSLVKVVYSILLHFHFFSDLIHPDFAYFRGQEIQCTHGQVGGNFRVLVFLVEVVEGCLEVVDGRESLRIFLTKATLVVAVVEVVWMVMVHGKEMNLNIVLMKMAVEELEE